MGPKISAGGHSEDKEIKKMSSPKYSIIIRCYNEENHIGRLLSGIMQQTLDDYEIILVDSRSTNATLAIASRYPVKIMNIEPEQFSFGRSLNVGCQTSRGDILIIVSAHVYPVYKDWLEQLVMPFSDLDVALTYGKQRGDASTQYSEQQLFKNWFPNEEISYQDYPFCNNANAAIRKSIWQKIHFNEQLTGLEDIDWAKKSMQLGYKIVYLPSAEAIHVHEESAKAIYNRYFRESMALKQIFPHERFSFFDFIRLFIANSINDMYHALHDRVLLKNIKNILVFRLMQFWGTFCGVAQRKVIKSQLRQRLYYPNGFRKQQHINVLVKENKRVDYAFNK